MKIRWSALLVGTFIFSGSGFGDVVDDTNERTTLSCILSASGPSGTYTVTNTLDTTLAISAGDFSVSITRSKSSGVVTMSLSRKDPLSEIFRQVTQSSVRIQAGTRGDNTKVSYTEPAMQGSVTCTLN